MFNYIGNLVFNMTHTLLPCTLFIANFMAILVVVYFTIWCAGFLFGGIAAVIKHFINKN